jgi:hypothetical protein
MKRIWLSKCFINHRVDNLIIYTYNEEEIMVSKILITGGAGFIAMGSKGLLSLG